ncbi:MAG: glycosyltransferase, partial [Gammaproteobacteria bacterium]|nr:glycosyltransferase [Gammaproteobacteria bacterium]
MVRRVMIMAGGTGGHVFPALAVAHELQQQGVEVSWLGTRAGLEAIQVARAGIPIAYLAIKGMRGK